MERISPAALSSLSGWSMLPVRPAFSSAITAGRTGLECEAQESTSETSGDLAIGTSEPPRENTSNPAGERAESPAVQEKIAPVQTVSGNPEPDLHALVTELTGLVRELRDENRRLRQELTRRERSREGR